MTDDRETDMNSASCDPIFDVSGKVCVVTGGSSGLGAAFAQCLIARGARVVNLSRTAPNWSFDPAQVFDVRGDVTDHDALAKAIDAATARFGSLDVLINNAGTLHVAKASRWREDEASNIMSVNVLAAAKACQLAHRVMVRQSSGGSIINVSSVLAERPLKGLSAYGASKAAIEGLTRSMAAEWAGDSVRVNALAPGWFDTAMTGQYFEKGVRSYVESRVPMGRLGTGADLYGALLLLVSDASRYMTGTVLHVDGGYRLG